MSVVPIIEGWVPSKIQLHVSHLKMQIGRRSTLKIEKDGESDRIQAFSHVQTAAGGGGAECRYLSVAGASDGHTKACHCDQ